MGSKGSEINSNLRSIIIHEVTVKRTPLGVVSGNSLRDLGRHIPKSSVQGIVEHALESAAIDNSHPLDPRNTATYQRSGRPKRFTEKQIDRLIKHATKSKP
jgi:hypothetical protein